MVVVEGMGLEMGGCVGLGSLWQGRGMWCRACCDGKGNGDVVLEVTVARVIFLTAKNVHHCLSGNDGNRAILNGGHRLFPCGEGKVYVVELFPLDAKCALAVSSS